MNVLSRTCQETSSLWLLKWVQVVPTVKERRRSWISEDERMEEHIFHSTRKSRVVSDDVSGQQGQCLAWDSGPWNTNLRPTADPWLSDGAETTPRWADHRCEATAETYSGPLGYAGQQVWPHAKSWQCKREQAIPLAGVTLPWEATLVSSFRARRGWASHAGGAVWYFLDRHTVV